MTSGRHIRPRAIELLAFDQVQLLDVAGPLQVFTSCNDLLAERGERPVYRVRVLSPSGGYVSTSSGLSIATETLSAIRSRLDTLIVAGGFGVDVAARDARLLEWVRRRSAIARRSASVCTGAFLLAAAGLLDGRRATTHWHHARRLADRHPAVTVDAEPIFVEDDGVWTSAGVTAGIDMALALVERDVDRAMALAIARRLVVHVKRSGGQNQFSASLASQSATRFGALIDWMREHPASDLRVPALAARAAMSERHFSRAFIADTGSTPAAFVERVRVDAARAALEGDGPLARIAQQCGFGSTDTLRRAFVRVIGVSPVAYRRGFQR